MSHFAAGCPHPYDQCKCESTCTCVCSANHPGLDICETRPSTPDGFCWACDAYEAPDLPQGLDEMAPAPSSREQSAFVLDLAENPHPRMLALALVARCEADADANEDGAGAYWLGYLDAMCAATGETPEAIEAWMDRAVSRNVERPEGA